jgi:hypothetical protein
VTGRAAAMTPGRASGDGKKTLSLEAATKMQAPWHDPPARAPRHLPGPAACQPAAVPVAAGFWNFAGMWTKSSSGFGFAAIGLGGFIS